MGQAHACIAGGIHDSVRVLSWKYRSDLQASLPDHQYLKLTSKLNSEALSVLAQGNPCRGETSFDAPFITVTGREIQCHEKLKPSVCTE